MTPPLYTVIMLFFGHTGITLGAAVLTTGAIETLRHHRARYPLVAWTLALSRYVDIRLLLIASLLPDIIDKPLGYFLFRNGRVFSHTLLFAVVLLAGGIWLYRRRQRRWLLTLGIGTLAHLVLDAMWQSPQTLLWPCFDWRFPQYPEANWLSIWFDNLTGYPQVYIPEIIGGLNLISFAVLVISRKKIKMFIRRGKI